MTNYVVRLIASWVWKYLRVYRIVARKPAEAFAFVLLTLGVGALGLWGPPLIAFRGSHPAGPEFTKALQEGAGYFFGLSTVATAMTFFAKEYLGYRDSEFRVVKLTGGVLAGGLLMFMMLLLGTQIQVEILDPSKTISESPVGLQAILTGISFFVALYLFCLEQIDDFPEIGGDLKDRSKVALRQAIKKAKDPDIQV